MSIEPLARLSKDLRAVAVTMTDDEARYLVDMYYQMQDNRIRADGQLRELNKNKEPNAVLDWFSGNATTLEDQIKVALERYAQGSAIGRWSMSVYGIGPIIAAGLSAHIDITKAPTVGHIWNFAGLNPGVVWEKGKKRPWNASLKVLCWKIGQSFMKFHNQEKCFYGHVYAARKELEMQRNEAGELGNAAALVLETKKFRRDTTAKVSYEAGKLPPAHIDARARRVAVKLFLSHWHAVAYKEHFGVDPAPPYAIAILQHAHLIPPDAHLMGAEPGKKPRAKKAKK